MNELNHYIGAAFIALGAAFTVLASIGVLRMPDVLMRMQAAAKAGTLGIACIAIGAAIHFMSLLAAAEAVLLIALFLLTAPVASHLIGRAAYIIKLPLYERTHPDELRGRYDEPPAGETAEEPR